MNKPIQQIVIGGVLMITGVAMWWTNAQVAELTNMLPFFFLPLGLWIITGVVIFVDGLENGIK